MTIKYKANPVHRNGTPGKTQWNKLISEAEEELIFEFGNQNSWQYEKNIFSFKWNGQTPVPFIDDDNQLNYARFVGASDWHGFPANVKRSPSDLPPYKILKDWIEKKYTTRARVSKLRKRLRCTI